MYLMDRKTGKLFTVPTENSWPRPVGERQQQAVQRQAGMAAEEGVRSHHGGHIGHSHCPLLLRAGTRSGSEVKLGSGNKMERFLNTLDNYLQQQSAQLQQVGGAV